jgi:hypothetical protein
LQFVLGTGEDAPPEKLLYPKPLFFEFLISKDT